MKLIFAAMVLLFFVASCTEKSLPYLGHSDVMVDGDTLYHQVYPFAFKDYNGNIFTNDSIQGEVHVAFYFFTHCPSICPKVISQVKRIRNALPNLPILAYTCDPIRDDVERLKYYHDKHAINDVNWHFLTGEEEDLNVHGVDSYLLANREDVLAPGGFLHSEKIVLVDRRGHLRGFFDGTVTQEVDKLIDAVNQLLNSDE